MKLSVEHAKRLLGSVDDQAFWLVDGRKVSSLQQLAAVLENANGGVWEHHVRDSGNDFANWIQGVFADDDLANHVRLSTDAPHAARLIRSKIKRLQLHLAQAAQPHIVEKRSLHEPVKKKEPVKATPDVIAMPAPPVSEPPKSEPSFVPPPMSEPTSSPMPAPPTPFTEKPVEKAPHLHQRIRSRIGPKNTHDEALGELMRQQDELEQKEQKLLEIEKRIETKYHSLGGPMDPEHVKFFTREFIYGFLIGGLSIAILCLIVLKIAFPEVLPF